MTNQLYVVEDNIEMNPCSREVNAARVLFCSMKPGQSFLCTQKTYARIYKWCQKEARHINAPVKKSVKVSFAYGGLYE